MGESDILTQEPEQTSADPFLDGWDDRAPVSEAETEAAPETTEAPEQKPAAPEQTKNQTPASPTGPNEVVPEEKDEQRSEGEADEQSAATDTELARTPPKTWELRHLDEVRTVGEADMVVLAQKGLDYDRIRTRYDESKPVVEMFGQFAKKAGMTMADYITHIRTQAMQSQGMSEADARRAVELEDREARVAAKEAEEAAKQQPQQQAKTAQQTAEARRQADILEFQRTFPEAAKDPKSIPPEVWGQVRQGLTLTAAYAKWRVSKAESAAQAAAQAAAAKAQEQRNASRSTGSLRSAGDETNNRDPFLEGFSD